MCTQKLKTLYPTICHITSMYPFIQTPIYPFTLLKIQTPLEDFVTKKIKIAPGNMRFALLHESLTYERIIIIPDMLCHV